MLSTSPRKPRSGASGSSAGAGHRTRADEAAVLAVQPDRASAVPVDERSQLLVEFAQRHLDDVERALVGDAVAAIALVSQAHLLHQLVDAPAAAVHDDGLHADQAQQRDVAREARLQRRIGHRVAAEADHQRLAVERAQVGKRFGEDAGFLGGVHGATRGFLPRLTLSPSPGCNVQNDSDDSIVRPPTVRNV